jgi:hypothetical protein
MVNGGKEERWEIQNAWEKHTLLTKFPLEDTKGIDPPGFVPVHGRLISE